MALHKFKVGQRVGLVPSRSQIPSGGDYKITMQVPPSNGENQYRVKGTAEAFERMVRESELVRR